ncbi:HAD-IB family phosphatase [Haloferula rosea]|nr:HAD-IB family phosphatase [Haloferula rosea]
MSDLSIEISIDDQTLSLIRGTERIQSWPVSSARKGVGNQPESHRTPTGTFRICETIGADADPGTIFQGRQPVGVWSGDADDHDLILSRILWLDGTDPENANTRERFIYIHGTNHESLLGQPVSCGCIRMSNEDIIELFQHVGVDTEVRILAPTRPRQNLIFFDCDSTLSTIEGIDELARAKGESVFHQVEALTHQAMNGEVPVEEVFGRRMEMIHPDRELCEAVARQYVETQTEGAKELIERLKQAGWHPVILSGGFAPLIQPLAEELGIQDIEAVPLHLNPDGSYKGFGENYPTTRNGGKPEVIREWKQALLPKRILMVGDGNSDLESRSECEAVIGYGGVVSRAAVKEGADHWITSLRDFPEELIG